MRGGPRGSGQVRLQADYFEVRDTVAFSACPHHTRPRCTGRALVPCGQLPFTQPVGTQDPCPSQPHGPWGTTGLPAHQELPGRGSPSTLATGSATATVGGSGTRPPNLTWALTASVPACPLASPKWFLCSEPQPPAASPLARLRLRGALLPTLSPSSSARPVPRPV